MRGSRTHELSRGSALDRKSSGPPQETGLQEALSFCRATSRGDSSLSGSFSCVPGHARSYWKP